MRLDLVRWTALLAAYAVVLPIGFVVAVLAAILNDFGRQLTHTAGFMGGLADQMIIWGRRYEESAFAQHMARLRARRAANQRRLLAETDWEDFHQKLDALAEQERKDGDYAKAFAFDQAAATISALRGEVERKRQAG